MNVYSRSDIGMVRKSNQDDVNFKLLSDNMAWAVVCDGMGSRPRSREGARAATLAVRDAWRLWQKSPVGLIEDLIRLIEAAWRLRLGIIKAEEAATTCLFYAEDEYGRAAQAQDRDVELREFVGIGGQVEERERRYGIETVLGREVGQPAVGVDHERPFLVAQGRESDVLRAIGAIVVAAERGSRLDRARPEHGG